jgi:hypothetical protein
MKKFIILILTGIGFTAHAQDTLQTLNFNRNHIKHTGMEVLGTWAIANMAGGGIGWASTGGTTKYFYQMDALWNIANLGAAIGGYLSSKKDKDRHYTPEESLTEQRKLENIFLVNGCLDVAYIGTGFYLKHRGDVKNNEQLKGYGPAIILQGAFLLLFDGTMYTTVKNNGSKLRKFLLKNPVTFDGKKAGIILNM